MLLIAMQQEFIDRRGMSAQNIDYRGLQTSKENGTKTYFALGFSLSEYLEN